MSTSTDRRIKTLKARQKSILTSFNLIKTFVGEYTEDSIDEVPVRLDHLVSLWTDFNTVQRELETLLSETAFDEQLKQRSEFETSYYHVKGFLLSKNKSPPSPTTPPGTQSSFPHVSTTSSHVRLPDIKLPTFGGLLESWLNFHDLYVSLVHSSAELSNIQKFYYLRSSLTGDALKLIQTIPISSVNYTVAWNLLTEHFQNPARLKQTYVDALFEFPSLKKESASDLHSLVEKFEANVKVLKHLGEKTEFWDIMLIRMLSIRLDPTTRRDWEEYSSTQKNISFQNLTSFIQRRVNVLETLGSKPLESPSSNVPKKPTQRPISSHSANQVNNARKCVVCSEHHPLYLCASFSKLDVEGKEKEVRRHQLCRNCLRKGHQSRECSSSSSCRHCRGRHHSQLCPESSVPATSRTVEPPQSKHNPPTSSNDQPKVSVSATIAETGSYTAAGKRVQNVLLATAIVILIDDNGIEHVARALLDSGSECCFITESLAQLIHAKRLKISVPITGIGQSSTHAKHKIVSTIRSRISEYSTTIEFIVLPKVTIDLPSASIDTSSWKIPSEIQLADPAFCSKDRVDLVLGAEIFFDLFRTSGRIKLGESLPMLVNSVLGWVVSGKTTSGRPTGPVVANVATISDLHSLMERFWSLEEDSSASCHSVEEAACEEHFRNNTYRTQEGRYVVRLPVKKDVLANLGDNRSTAVRRFRMLEGRLSRNQQLGQQYQDFITEYHSLGHMAKVDDYQNPPSPNYHLPHHAVIREDSTTTKVRVVFDASCKTTKGASLNDALMIGPTVQQDLRSIILRSRTRPVMLIADIKQMYRQILVDEQDTPLQRIVWRSSPDSPLDTYELKTVTYGTACAPYLATRVLLQLAEDERTNFPKAAEILSKDFYVDDLFSGGDNVDETIELREQLESLLAKGGFQLRKWASNEEAVLEGVAPENRALQSSFDLDRDQCIKTLGLHWEPASDHLRYRIQLPPESAEVLTKRTVLSLIARLFDPLGLVGPVVTTAKLFMQGLWMLKDDDEKVWGWDKELPTHVQDRWHAFQSQLPTLNELRIDRFILCPNPIRVQLHFFSDASEHAYGACCYVRSSNSSCTKVALMTAKSKVAPLKQQSIPRLELCGALLAAELYEKVSSAVPLATETFFWVDSTTVLSWLKATPTTWTTFVGNRVSKIQLATRNCVWNHVAGHQNPADLISRGTSAENLLQSTLWWAGPDWLQQDDTHWPIQRTNDSTDTTTTLEVRKVPKAAIVASTEESFIDGLVKSFNCYDTMVKAVAFCRRFGRNARVKHPSRKLAPVVDSEELKEAEKILIRLVQQQEYNEEIRQLQDSGSVSPKSRLRWFSPFIGPDQLLRIGGRLTYSQQPYDSKHQIILPGSHPLCTLLVRTAHQRHLHAATQLLVSILRLHYWITGARNLAKKVIHSCVDCCKARPQLVQQYMAELPAARVTSTRPFTVTGIDYWGPILLKAIHRRAQPQKAYVAVFVCFSTKAIHIELVLDLSTFKFLQALRRFVSRRGLCAEVHSDNGRNFVGAANELRQLISSSSFQNELAQECSTNGIRWVFNPPKASHFGGLWEAAIYSAQKHFVRVLGKTTLAADDMQTLLAQIECCLNSRPIVPISDDPSDLEPLTPGHFLTGAALNPHNR